MQRYICVPDGVIPMRKGRHAHDRESKTAPRIFLISVVIGCVCIIFFIIFRVATAHNDSTSESIPDIPVESSQESAESVDSKILELYGTCNSMKSDDETFTYTNNDGSKSDDALLTYTLLGSDADGMKCLINQAGLSSIGDEILSTSSDQDSHLKMVGDYTVMWSYAENSFQMVIGGPL
ncbi:MAG: hypothetical protein ABF966_09630 [Bifidobacterium psychraerophilum]|uniref:hypothetical protein n=1 Tax=Bifidobacterium psychraerophilum TaxID=218140 RepID=UPI0039ECAA37